MDENFHRGKLIRAELDSQEHSVSWFARKVQTEYSNCFYIFKRQFVDVDLLMKISIVLRHNFFIEMSEYMNGIIKDSTDVLKNNQ